LSLNNFYNFFDPAALAAGAQCRRWFDISEPFGVDRRLTGTALNNRPYGVLPRMMEVIVAKRRRSWEWRVHQNGTLMMHGRERSRPAARYQGYRSLFMLLAIGRRSTAFGTSETFSTDQSNSGASRSWS
jgi:hypothetical protein